MYKRYLSLEEIHQLESEILKQIDKFCEKNGIQYFMAGGTLLGAVRHQGFIPWDDDIDLLMPRPDYQKFIDCVKKDSIGEDLVVFSNILNRQYLDTTMRVCNTKTKIDFDWDNKIDIGVWVDILPIDGVPSDLRAAKCQFKKIRFLLDCLILASTKIGMKRRNKILSFMQYFLYPLQIVLKIIGRNKIVKMIDKAEQKYNLKEMKYVACYEGRAGIKEIMPKTEFLRPIKIPFEQYEFMAPSNYDYYLKRLYGNYMVPRNDMRRTIKAYWRK